MQAWSGTPVDAAQANWTQAPRILSLILAPLQVVLPACSHAEDEVRHRWKLEALPGRPHPFERPDVVKALQFILQQP